MGFEFGEQFVHIGVVDRAVILVADLEKWGSITSVKAFDFVEGEESVGGGFAKIYAEFFFEVITNSICSAHVAGEACTDFDHMFADAVGGVVHAVERCNAFDLGIRAVEPVGDFGDRVAAEVSAVFSLSDPETGEDTGFFVGVVGFESFELVDGGLGELEFEFFGSGCFWPFVYGSELNQVAHRFSYSTVFEWGSFGRRKAPEDFVPSGAFLAFV